MPKQIKKKLNSVFRVIGMQNVSERMSDDDFT